MPIPVVRVLGIDPGSVRTGFGVIEIRAGRAYYLSSGIIRLPKVDFPQRLGLIFEGIDAVAREHAIDQVAIEDVFVDKNARSALKLGQARGAAIAAIVQRKLPVAEYTARRVKQVVAGSGGADKQQMQQMVTSTLKLSAAPSEDAADALAVALCHFYTGRPWK